MAIHAHSTPVSGDGDLRSLRRRVVEHIDRLIAILDALDGDPDLEPDEGFELSAQAEIRGGANVRAH